jgi:hypothetical protein
MERFVGPEPTRRGAIGRSDDACVGCLDFQRSSFDKLDASYDLTTDGATGDRLTLQVRTDESLHEVSVTVPAYAAELAKTISDRDDRGDVEEFLSLWAELLRYVRTPNRDQTRKLYRP